MISLFGVIFCNVMYWLCKNIAVLFISIKSNPKGTKHLTMQPDASATHERNDNENEPVSKTNMLLNKAKGDNIKQQADINETKEKQLTQADSMSE